MGTIRPVVWEFRIWCLLFQTLQLSSGPPLHDLSLCSKGRCMENWRLCMTGLSVPFSHERYMYMPSWFWTLSTPNIVIINERGIKCSGVECLHCYYLVIKPPATTENTDSKKNLKRINGANLGASEAISAHGIIWKSIQQAQRRAAADRYLHRSYGQIQYQGPYFPT